MGSLCRVAAYLNKSLENRRANAGAFPASQLQRYALHLMPKSNHKVAV